MIKAYRDGEITPFSSQTVRSLNAPFSANWNDYPTTEKMLPYCVGIAARFIGLMPAFNLAGLLAAILAALAFYIACRILGYLWVFAFVGAAIFGFSHYISGRVLSHLSLTYYWHIPFCLLVTWWCFDSRELSIGSRRWWFAVAVGAATGLQAIYYAFLFWQFLGFAVVIQGLRRNRPKLISVISVAAISVGCTVLMAAPYVLYRILHGSNSFVVQRSLGNLQIYGLQLPELFLPPFHRIERDRRRDVESLSGTRRNDRFRVVDGFGDRALARGQGSENTGHVLAEPVDHRVFVDGWAEPSFGGIWAAIVSSHKSV